MSKLYVLLMLQIPNYMFCSCFKLIILDGLQQTMGSHLLCLFLLVLLLCAVVISSNSSSFSSHKNGPIYDSY